MKIIGILNVTPDSFSDGGNYINIEKAVAHAKQMVADGADIIDVGGESTRPTNPISFDGESTRVIPAIRLQRAEPVSIDEELIRVIPVIKRLKEEINVPISIDTYKAEVAYQAVQAGAEIINDVGGAKFDPDMPKVMAESGVKVILMHNRRATDFGKYENLGQEIINELRESVDIVMEAGVSMSNIIVDPGIGFAKTLKQNHELLKEIERYRYSLPIPFLLGVSKKGTVRELMEYTGRDMLGIGTVAMTCWAYQKGIEYIRIHDVRENKLAINVMKNLK